MRQPVSSGSLARKNDSLGCHAVAVKRVGPAFKEVAAGYAGQGDAATQLSESIRAGRVGKWANSPCLAIQSFLRPMPTNLPIGS